MAARSFWRGHPIVARGDEWFYVDDGTAVADQAGRGRPCGRCGEDTPPGQIELDPCIGLLPGVDNACCGHGDPSESYIQFSNGVTVRGFTVEHREAPGPLQVDRPQKNGVYSAS